MERVTKSWLLMIEAVNFNSVLFDVDDLSAIRGGGEAMLEAPAWILSQLRSGLGSSADIEQIYSAASHVLARVVPGNLSEERLTTSLEAILSRSNVDASITALASAAGSRDMLAHLISHLIPQLCFAWGLAPEADGIAAVERALRLSQMRRLSVDVPPARAAMYVATDRPCRHDYLRPACVSGTLPDGTMADLSLSMALRRSLGRTGRREEFYKRILLDGGEARALPECSFSNDFSELIESPPKVVPQQIENKIALISLDANDLGKLRQGFVADVATAASFAGAIKAMRGKFLSGILHWAASQDFMLLHAPERTAVDGLKRTIPVLRFEMLAWGADEMTFVIPAWALEPFLIMLAERLSAKHWTIDESDSVHVITHSMGVVVASHKAPIKLFKSLSGALTDDAKSVCRNSNMLQYWIAGSIDMPTRELDHERATLYQVGISSEQSKAFTLPLDEAAGGLTLLRTVKGESGDKAIGIPRQKLMTLCTSVDAAADDAAAITRRQLQSVLTGGVYRDQSGQPITADAILECPFFAATAKGGARTMRYRHMLELWPYVGLFGECTPSEVDEASPL